MRIDKYLSDQVTLVESSLRHHVSQRAVVANHLWEMQVFINRWIDNNCNENLLCLADYGSGKTHFTLWLQAHIVSGNADSKIRPIIIKCSKYKKFGSLIKLIQSSLYEEGLLKRNSFDELRDIFNRSNVVLILDGLDEIQTKRNTSFITDLIFNEISNLPITVAGKIVTARANWFLGDEQTPESLDNKPTYKSSLFRVVTLQDFTREDSLQFIKLRLPQVPINDLNKHLLHLHNTQVLSKPLHCKMFCDLYNVLEDKRLMDEINPYEMYFEYSRRVYKVGLESEFENLVNYAVHIAETMFEDDTQELTVSRIREKVSSNLRNKLNTDFNINETIGKLPLSRSQDILSFSHPSWLDFYLSISIYESLLKKKLKPLNIGIFPLSTIQFLKDKLKANSDEINWEFWAMIGHKNIADEILIKNLLVIFESAEESVHYENLILNSIKSPEVNVKVDALKVAGYSEIKIGVETLTSLLHEKNWLLRYLTIEFIGLHKIDHVTNYVINTLSDESKELQSISMWALRKLRNEKCVELALSKLNENDSSLKTWSMVLGYNQSKKALEYLLKIDSSRIKTDELVYVQEAIDAIKSGKKINWLEIINDQNKTQKILNGDSNWEKRYLIETIGELRPVRYSELLISIYPIQNDSFKNTIIDALGESKDKKNVEFLIECFWNETSNRVKSNVLWALGNIKDTRAIPTFYHAKSSLDSVISSWGLWGIRQLRASELYSMKKLEYYYPM